MNLSKSAIIAIVFIVAVVALLTQALYSLSQSPSNKLSLFDRVLKATEQSAAISRLRKTSQLIEAKEEGIVGITCNCLAGNHYPLIDLIATDSPAQKAGIKAGMYLIKIDGRYCLPMSGGEIASSLRGKPGTIVSVTVSDRERGALAPGGKEQSYNLTRIPVRRLPSEDQQIEMITTKPQNYEDPDIEKSEEKEIETPFFITSPRIFRQTILEFYDDRSGPSKKPPAFVAYVDGNRFYNDPGAGETKLKRFNIKDPDNMALAAKFGITAAPAVVFFPIDDTFVHPSQIESNPLKNNALRTLMPSQKRAIPGTW